MIRLIRRLYADERVRFLIVGAINTVIGYVFFAIFQLTIGRWIGYFGSLYLSYACAVVIAFTLHRNVTFRVAKSGSVMMDFLRFNSVYVLSLAINTVALPLLVEVVGIEPLLAQAIIVSVTTVISYVGHKWFTFRRPATSADDARPASDEPGPPA